MTVIDNIVQELRNSGENVWNFRRQLKDEGINLFCDDQADYYMIHKIVTGYLPAEHMHSCDYADFHNALADLLESKKDRTCTIDSWRYESYGDITLIEYELSCGHKSEGFSMPNHCPICGAKIINGDGIL